MFEKLINLFRTPYRPQEFADSSSVPEDEKQYYQANEYYRYRPFGDMGGEVLDYSTHIRDAIPSRRGLYPPEILLIYYCNTYHCFPIPKRGTYQSFWWFKYGIRDIGAVLRSLYERGFLEYDEDCQYIATREGLAEISENEYIPYVHKNTKTVGIDVWEINKRTNGAPEKGIEIFNQLERKNEAQNKKAKERDMAIIREADPEGAALLEAQDVQIEIARQAKERYKQTLDNDEFVRAWDKIYRSEKGVLAPGSWPYEAIDAYLRAGDIASAEFALDMLASKFPNQKAMMYHQKYIKRIEKAKS